VKVKIFVSILSLFFLLGLGFYFLPYSYQWRIAQWPLEVGGKIDSSYGDVIIVPGAGCNPGRGTEERLNVASSLYQIKQRKIIVSEGYCFPHERKDFMRRIATRWKIDTNNVIWDTLSFTTEENIFHSAELCQKLGLKSAILCTSPHHQLRCKVLMNKFWPGDFEIAEMKDSMKECNKEPVYVNKRGKTIKQEYLKTIYQLLFL
jgi:uncharacterized SAM-binding protein YcdF (DUF218 family)